ncbi:hypothetical protein KAU15_07215 [candidate division WOR-3 bacterium]|nr:hypothetical protein [candidate division WOR-3 bacterium]
MIIAISIASFSQEIRSKKKNRIQDRYTHKKTVVMEEAKTNIFENLKYLYMGAASGCGIMAFYYLIFPLPQIPMDGGLLTGLMIPFSFTLLMDIIFGIITFRNNKDEYSYKKKGIHKIQNSFRKKLFTASSFALGSIIPYGVAAVILIVCYAIFWFFLFLLILILSTNNLCTN